MQEAEERHPFLEGLSRHRGAAPTILVIFGASGDLTARKLIPALFNLGLDSLLPSDFHLIGFGRKPIEDEAFRKIARESIEEFSRRPMDEELWGDIEPGIHYHSGGYDEAEVYRSLEKKIKGIESSAGREMQLVFYISTPPTVFEPIIENLGASGLSTHLVDGKPGAKVIIEKPFGRDLESARRLNQVIGRNFDESQVYRIDHYLGKETVQNLLVARFANAIFEPIWNREFVDCVQITVAESVGVGSRGGYYDESGALRDMIQNHTMQLLSLIAMEPPVSLDPESIRDEKVKVLKGIQPLALDPADKADVVRARYTEGLMSGKQVPGYLQEKNIPGDSSTETYAAMRLMINNWRWKGVPFYLRSGKRLARRVSEIAIQFKRPPGILFSESKKYDVAHNTLVIQVQPDEGMTLLTNSKVPGLETRTQPVKMHFRYAATFGSNTPEAYERLILDAMIGDSTLFIRGDETEASWKLMTPVLESWKSLGQHGLGAYAAGSWGPAEAERLLGMHGHEWRQTGI
ncbi:glucose-6-phosphate dehydrogenase [Puniceicoccales bacterium CK1056]|uniref:Glucose-6-phosphate 1-dehydrogenase n=1 Tax=Oceanipulchritudo coccoides TaxID=2706888 RepID=A0A6B2LZ05_9BACT|nr:glucose-6-phosphate dehydrogenase [Oceanipulchritudo coccoides]NDV61663.1 glucose-6-phosphate dehydrogenase [Oceanipulchritudo coccoides]